MTYTAVETSGTALYAFLLPSGDNFLLPGGGNFLLSAPSGLSIIVSNTVEDIAGSSYVVSNDALDTIAGTHLIFTATVEVNTVKIINFRLSDSLNRMFRL
jgi:hypothetical protein